LKSKRIKVTKAQTKEKLDPVEAALVRPDFPPTDGTETKKRV